MILDLTMRAWMTVLDAILFVLDAIFDGIAWLACTLFWLVYLRWWED